MRVVEALTILTAAGYFNDSNYTIVPVLFDFDLANANLFQAEECLRLYLQLYKKSGDASFFSHKLTPLYRGDSSFLFDMERQDETLYERYRLHSLFEECDGIGKLAESLMGDIYTFDSFLQKPLEKIHNFTGNYARLMMGDLSRKDDFCKLFSQVGKNDVFVVVGSTYGNTGTAAIFELANTLSHHFPSMRKAVVMLLPFFEDRMTAGYDEEEMEMRSKETLSFFHHCNISDKFDSSYCITAQTLSRLSMETGGMQQHIPFTIFDMIAVTAVADFLKRKDEKSLSPKTFYFSMPRHQSEGFNIDDLCAIPVGKRIVDCLTRFSLAMKYVDEEKAGNDGPVWRELGQFAEIYCQWIESMYDVGGGNGLSLFQLRGSQFSQILKDRDLVRRHFLFNSQLFSKKDFIKAMGDKSRPLLEQLTQASDHIFNEYIAENL